MQLHEQNRKDIIERQTKDMNTQIASSYDYTTHALRAMNPPINRAPTFNIFGTHSASDHSLQQAQQ